MAKLSERKEAWFRIIVLVVSGIVLYIWGWVVGILAIANWLITVLSGKRNRELTDFSEYWNTECYKFMRYLTAVSNIRPFPFTGMEKMSKFEK